MQYSVQLNPFWDTLDRILIWFAQPTDLFGTSDSTYLIPVIGSPGKWPVSRPVWVAVCDINSRFDQSCQELAHAFTLNHEVDVSGNDYGSRYSIMSAAIYGGYSSIAIRAADARLPDGISPDSTTPPQRIVGPMLCAAQLYQFTWFSNDVMAVKLPSTFAQSAVSTKLYALDYARSQFPAQRLPCLAVIQRPTGTFYIEVRRSMGYDKAISATISSGIVVHSYNPATNRIVYEGCLPFATGSGDLDWSSARGGFTLRLQGVQDDNVSATFSVSGPNFWEQRWLDLQVTSATQEDVSRDQGMVYLNQECIKGFFDLDEIHRRFTYELEVVSYGFDSPRYSWYIDNVPVPSLANAKVTFNTTVTTPSPANASSS